MGRMLPRFWFGPIAFWLVLVAPAAIVPLAAQQSTSTDSTGAAAVRPIPTSAILDQASAVEQRLLDIEFLIAPSDAIRTIELDAVQFVEDLRDEAAEPLPPAGWSTRAEANLAQLWGRRERRLADWRSTIGSRVRNISIAVAELDSLVGLWDAMLADTTLPQVMADRVVTIARGVRELRGRTSDRLSALLSLEAIVVEGHRLARTRRNTLLGYIAASNQSLFTLDTPPLWSLQAWQGQPVPSLPSRTIGERIREVRAGMGSIWIFHLAATLLLFTIITFLRRPTPELPAGATAGALSRPISSTLLVSLFAGFWIYPLAPVGLYDFLIVGSFVPLIRVAKVMFLPGITAAIAGIGALTLGHRMIGLWATNQSTGRLLLFGAAALLVLGLGYLTRPDGPLGATSKGWAKGTRRAAQVGLGVAAIGLVTNLVGMVALSTYLTTGLVLVGFITPTLILCAMVLDETITLGLPRIPLDTVQQFHHQIIRWTRTLMRLLLLAAWIDLALLVFRVTGPVLGAVGAAFGAKIPLGVITISLGNLVLFVTTVWVGWALGRVLSTVLEVDILSRIDLRRGAAATIGTLFRYTFVAVAFVLAVAAIGVELTQLAIIGGALGVGIGFGLQSVVNNFMSGLILFFERPITVGDTIQLTNLQGMVTSIGLRATTIRAFDGSEVIVPNAELTSREVINWTKSDVARRIEIPVGVAYGSDPRQVSELLARVPATHRLTSAHPAPVALLTGFGESSLEFSVRFWTDSPEFLQVRSDVALAIHGALKEAGLQFPFPQRDVHLYQALAKTGASKSMPEA